MWWDLLSRSRRAHVEWCLRKGDWRFMWCLGQRDCYQPGDDPGCHQPLFLVWSAKEKGWADVHPLPVLGIEIIARLACTKDVTFLFSEMRDALLPLPLPVPPPLRFSLFLCRTSPLCHCMCVCKEQKPIANLQYCNVPYHTMPYRHWLVVQRDKEIEAYTGAWKTEKDRSSG